MADISLAQSPPEMSMHCMLPLEHFLQGLPFFEQASGDNLRRCQRYRYQYSGVNAEATGSLAYLFPIDATRNYRRGDVYFPSQMRAAPTITRPSGRLNNASNVTLVAQNQNINSFSLAIEVSTANTDYIQISGYEATAEL